MLSGSSALMAATNRSHSPGSPDCVEERSRGKLSRRPELRLYLQGEPQPLRLFPQRDPADVAAASRSYPQFVREVAARLASGGGFARIETGSGKVWAAISTVLVSLPAIGMVGVFASTVLLTLPHAERWIARSFTAIVAVAAIWLAAWWWREHWPRRVRRLTDLDRALPVMNEG